MMFYAFGLWARPQDELHQFYDDLNLYYHVIDLTMEMGASKNHYLDLTIRLEEEILHNLAYIAKMNIHGCIHSS